APAATSRRRNPSPWCGWGTAVRNWPFCAGGSSLPGRRMPAPPCRAAGFGSRRQGPPWSRSTSFFPPSVAVTCIESGSVTRPQGDAPVSQLDRRQLLRCLAGAGALAVWNPAFAADPKPDRERIKAENDREGTTDWQLTYTKVD